MSILVTGGAGFIGSNFVLDWLAQSDEPVLNLDALTYAGNLENLASLAGHAVVEDRAVIGGMAGVHQFVKIGRNAMVGGASKVVQDVPPFVIADGRPARVSGLNSVGMARAGISEDVRRNLKKAYRILFRSGLKLSEAIATMEQELDSSEPVEHLLRFLRNVNRGICRSRREEESTEL